MEPLCTNGQMQSRWWLWGKYFETKTAVHEKALSFYLFFCISVFDFSGRETFSELIQWTRMAALHHVLPLIYYTFLNTLYGFTLCCGRHSIGECKKTHGCGEVWTGRCVAGSVPHGLQVCWFVGRGLVPSVRLCVCDRWPLRWTEAPSIHSINRAVPSFSSWICRLGAAVVLSISSAYLQL